MIDVLTCLTIFKAIELVLVLLYAITWGYNARFNIFIDQWLSVYNGERTKYKISDRKSYI